MPLDALEQVEPVAFVGPPGVHARVDQIDVLLPVVFDMRGVAAFRPAGRECALQTRQAIALPGNHVDDHLGVLGVQIVKHGFGIALKHARIEVERGLPRVPAGGREAGAQVDHGVERDFLFAERVDDVQDELLARQVLIDQLAMRLHVAQRPLGRHDGGPGDRRRHLS